MNAPRPESFASRYVRLVLVSEKKKWYDISFMKSGFTINHKNTNVKYDNNISQPISGTQRQFIMAKSGGAGFIDYNVTEIITYCTPTQIGSTCAIQGTPQCVKMCKGTFEIQGKFEDAPVIHLPVWLEVTKAGPKTRAAWKTVVDNILAHERLHEAVHHKYRNNNWWATWAKIKREINVCVDDPQRAKEIAEEYVKNEAYYAKQQENALYDAYRKAQQKIDDDEQAAGYPTWKPMLTDTPLSR